MAESWGTFATVKLSDGRFFWAAWPDWRAMAKPIQTGFTENRFIADTRAETACQCDKASGVKDGYAESAYYDLGLHKQGIEPNRARARRSA